MTEAARLRGTSQEQGGLDAHHEGIAGYPPAELLHGINEVNNNTLPRHDVSEETLPAPSPILSAPPPRGDDAPGHGCSHEEGGLAHEAAGRGPPPPKAAHRTRSTSLSRRWLQAGALWKASDTAEGAVLKVCASPRPDQSVTPGGDADAKHRPWLFAISLLALTVALGAMSGYVWRMRPARTWGTENDASDDESPRGGNARATRSPVSKRKPTVLVPQCLALERRPAAAPTMARQDPLGADAGAAVVPDDGDNLARLLAPFFAKREGPRWDEYYIMSFIELLHRTPTQTSLFWTGSQHTYLQAALSHHPLMAEHCAWLCDSGQQNKLRADGAPADFRRFRTMLRLIDDAVGTKLHHATRSSFAEVSRAVFRTAE